MKETGPEATGPRVPTTDPRGRSREKSQPAALFTIGKSLIGIYIGRTALDSTYGAAASLVVVLVWIYYSSLILFFGAEFTHVYAKRRGSQVVEARRSTNFARPVAR